MILDTFRFFSESIIGSAEQLNLSDHAANEKAMSSILSSVYFVAGVIAVTAIIVAGIKYITSAGDPQKIQSSKNAITYAVMGLIFVMLAFVITNSIIGKVQ